MYYKGNPTTLIGHEQEAPWPNYTEYMDYELELEVEGIGVLRNSIGQSELCGWTPVPHEELLPN